MMTISVSTPAARQTAFVNLPVDFLLVGGLSIFHFLIFYSFLRDPAVWLLSNTLGPPLQAALDLFWATPPNIYQAASLAMVLTWVINHPHFSATNHRLYRNRESMMQFPITAFGVPMLLMVLLTAALMFPNTIGPWFVKLFLIWSPYHFSAQTLGITLLYARRSGFVFTPALRKAAAVFIFGTYLGPTLTVEDRPHLAPYYGITVPTFGLPGDLYLFYKSIVIIAGIIFALLLLREAWRQDKRIPLLLITPAIAQYVWFISGAGVKGFQEFVPAYHSLQYLLIAWAINLKERADEGHIERTPLRARLESGRWLALNIAGGVFLFFVLPKFASMSFHVDPYAAAGLVVAAVQIHHFFVDGVIWKLRNPRVGQPLMTSWPELAGKASS